MDNPKPDACWCRWDDDLADYLQDTDITLPLRHCLLHRDPDDGTHLQKDMVECCDSRFYNAEHLAEHNQQAHRPLASILPETVTTSTTGMEDGQEGDVIPHAGSPRMDSQLPVVPDMMDLDEPILTRDDDDPSRRYMDTPSPGVNLSPTMGWFLPSSPDTITDGNFNEFMSDTPEKVATTFSIPDFSRQAPDQWGATHTGFDEAEIDLTMRSSAGSRPFRGFHERRPPPNSFQNMDIDADMNVYFNAGSGRPFVESTRFAPPPIMALPPRTFNSQIAAPDAKKTPFLPYVPMRISTPEYENPVLALPPLSPNPYLADTLPAKPNSLAAPTPRTNVSRSRPIKQRKLDAKKPKPDNREPSEAVVEPSPSSRRKMQTRASTTKAATVITENPFRSYTATLHHLKTIQAASPAITAQFISTLTSLTGMEDLPIQIHPDPSTSTLTLSPPLPPSKRRNSHVIATRKLRAAFKSDPSIIEGFARILALSTAANEEMSSMVSGILGKEVVENIRAGNEDSKADVEKSSAKKDKSKNGKSMNIAAKADVEKGSAKKEKSKNEKSMNVTAKADVEKNSAKKEKSKNITPKAKNDDMTTKKKNDDMAKENTEIEKKNNTPSGARRAPNRKK